MATPAPPSAVVRPERSSIAKPLALLVLGKIHEMHLQGEVIFLE
jgi:hypothetical protein